MDKILTVSDVAEALKLKPITVREMFREGRLRAFKVGKAWRTTETLLQEDLEALARDERPATVAATFGGKKSTAVAPAPPAAPVEEAAAAPPADTEAPTSPEPVQAPEKDPVKPPRVPKAAEPKPSEPKPSEPKPKDDTQQMLF